MKTLVALTMLAALALTVQAQDETEQQNLDLGVYGRNGHEAAAELAESLGARLVLHGMDADELPQVAWAVRKQATPQQAARLLGQALGCQALLDSRGKALHLYLPGEVLRGSKVKGYDVSVLAGRFVEYVNAYGKAREPEESERDESSQRTAADHLASVLAHMLDEPRGVEFDASVVGDRLLYTTDDPSHARIREALDLLMAEHGGESAELKEERAAIEKLKESTFAGELTDTPVASVITEICAAAGLGVVLGPGLALFAGQEHIDFKPKGSSAWEALHDVLAQLREREWTVEFTAREGVLILDDIERESISSGYRVYEIGDLLKKLDASFQRQRTAPGKREGFEGDLRSTGGNRVVLAALDNQLDEAHAPGNYDLTVFGARLIVRGSNGAVNAATRILKEMGWEEPGK